MGRCIIFCISDICLFLNFNEVEKKQLLPVVSITDAKKKKRISLLELVGYEGRRKYILLCDLIKHDFGSFFLYSPFRSVSHSIATDLFSCVYQFKLST